MFRGSQPENSEVWFSNNNRGLQHKDRERRGTKESGRKILNTRY
jgi:hypothetical protein